MDRARLAEAIGNEIAKAQRTMRMVLSPDYENRMGGYIDGLRAALLIIATEQEGEADDAVHGTSP